MRNKTKTQIFLIIATAVIWTCGILAGIFLGFENERIMNIKWYDAQFSFQLAFGYWVMFFALGAITLGLERIISFLKRK